MNPIRSIACRPPAFTTAYRSGFCGRSWKHALGPFALAFLVAAAAFGPAPTSGAARTNRPPQPARPQPSNATEEELIAVLQSDRSPAEKDAACARLKRIGSTRCIPALAALLADEQLSHSARYALESMPYPEAGAALIRALDQTSGPAKVGLIYSLGVRREAQTVPKLTGLLGDPDPALASAAATALGQIGGTAALKALQSAPASNNDPVHQARIDALLRCAQDLSRSSDKALALPVFRKLYDEEPAPAIRIAAYRGLILSSGKDGLSLATSAIAGPSGPSQVAALQLVSELDVPSATQALASLLPKADATVQRALIGGLSQRGDAAALPAIAALVKSTAPEVRRAVFAALGELGDGSVVALLAEAAAADTGDERNAARLALVQVRRGNATDAFLKELGGAQPTVQVELARALGERGEASAVPALLRLAQQGSGPASQAALQALARLADQPHLADMVQLVITAKTDDARAQAVETLNAVCQRIQARHSKPELGPLTTAVMSGAPAVRVALLPVCSGLATDDVRSALRRAVNDPSPAVRAAAIRALCDTRDTGLLTDLQRVVREVREANFRTLAVGACVRLTTEETATLNNAQCLQVLASLLAQPLRPEQKRLLLAGVAQVPELDSLKLAQARLDEADVQNESAQAAIKLSGSLASTQPQAATAALKKAQAVATDPGTRRAAETALKQLETNADFITAWQAAGPYLQEGKDYAALFDIVFPPETANATGVQWQTLPPSRDPKRPWLMDLLKAFGGEQRVAYARTWIHSDNSQPARLEIGADDGVKVWWNQKMIHANNTFRALQPGSDKADVALNPGWNLLLLKVTQLNQGWEFCARLVKPDGSHLDGLRFAAAPPEQR